jgi:hypothetical protein
MNLGSITTLILLQLSYNLLARERWLYTISYGTFYFLSSIWWYLFDESRFSCPTFTTTVLLSSCLAAIMTSTGHECVKIKSNSLSSYERRGISSVIRRLSSQGRPLPSGTVYLCEEKDHGNETKRKHPVILTKIWRHFLRRFEVPNVIMWR